ncbi:MAG TPA: hypothetical protein VGL54_09685 [Solirubrobacteraceae bacterium]|jgi:hypothetical protein
MRVSGLLPKQVLRAIDRVRTRWFHARIRAPTSEYVRRNGLEVRHGPFAGMRYLDGLEAAAGNLVTKLLGTYECELHGVVADWIAAEYPQLVDVGCAEGYYAVGFALAMPRTTVDAFDIDPAARAECTALAQLNGVGERVRVLGSCEPAALNAYPEQGVALLADCEGYERILLDPDLAPRLRSWPILVELHEFVDASIVDTIQARFGHSHEIEIVEDEERDGGRIEELAFMSTRQRTAVLGERRPGPMRWAHLRPL